MPSLPSRRAAAILLIGLLTLLDGCGPGKDEFPPACPRADLLWEAADLSRYRDESSTAIQDIRDLVLSARIIAIPAKCQQGDAAKLQQCPPPQPPPEDDQHATEGGRVLDKKVYVMRVIFPENVDQVALTSEGVHMVFPVSATKSGAAYTVLAGFQLTEQELAFNRRKGVGHP